MHFHKKSVKWALAPTLAVTMLFSTMGIATMTAATDPRDQPDTQAFHRPITTDSALSATTVSQPALVVTGPSVQADEELQEELFLEDDFTVTMPIWSDAPTPVDTEVHVSELNSLMALMASGTAPSYEETYNAMNALKSQPEYSEGTLWNNFTPYGRDSEKDAYWFQGGSVKGARGGVGCAAFVFILSDAAFGNLPATTIDNGGFTYDQIKVGDILRVNNSHFVIVMEKSAGGVIVAEGNYNSSVHWGRAISKAEVMAANFIVTRYPDGYVDPSDGAADTVEKSGTENDLKWTLTKAGILTISGNGAIPDYNPTENIMPSWNTETFNTVIIEDGVTSIGDYAFYQKASLLSAQLPDSITKIGNSAFRETGLVGITIPKKVTHIGDNAFRQCPNLVSASFNEGLETIGGNAFRSCTSLTYADFPTTITSVGAGAFFDCTNIVSVRFKPGTGDVHMGDDTFRNCQHLMTIVLPQKLTAISPGMFASCKILSTLYIPASVTKVGAEAGDLAQSPFESAGILQLNFGGSEDAWKSMVNTTINGSLQQYGTKISYNVPFTDPFAKDPNDPGDLIPDDTGEHPPTDPTPGEHQHNWAAEWSHNADYHWHACSAENCTVTEDSQKDGYAAHNYGDWVIDSQATATQAGSKHRDCNDCGYQQTESIPATGSGSGSSGSGSGSYGGSSSSGGSWYPGSSGGSWYPGSSGSSSGTSGSNTTTTTPPENTDDNTDTTKDPDTDSSNDTGNAEDPGAVPTPTPEQPDNHTNPNEPEITEPETNNTTVVTNKQKKQLKATMQTQMNKQMKPQLKKQLKTALKKYSKKLSNKQLKAKLQKQLKADLKAELKAQLKKEMKKQYGEEFGEQFTELFNQQFNAVFKELYGTQFNKYFKQLTK